MFNFNEEKLNRITHLNKLLIISMKNILVKLCHTWNNQNLNKI